jgi:zinc transport system permease protein
MLDALELPLFQRVLAAGLLASIACGIVGTYVVAKGFSSISGGLSHAAFGGVGLGYLLGFDPMLGALAFGLAAALLIGAARHRLASSLDTLVSAMWALGMALGILFVALAPGYAPDLSSYLFGSLLFAPWRWVAWVAALDVLLVAAVALLYKEFEAVSFDEEFAEVAGVRVQPVFLALLALTALAVVMLIRVVGVILAIALVTMPAAAARSWAGNLWRVMLGAVALSALCTAGGLWLSWGLSEAWDVSAPPGPLAVLLAAVLYAASGATRRAVGGMR